MTLEEASAAALQAAQAGDLDALAAALAARAVALARGEIATPGVHVSGESTSRLLRELIRETGLESARLQRLEYALGQDPEPPPQVDLAG
jgi:hypothetical protein